GRADGSRPAAEDPARGAGGSRAPGAADPCGLRREERPDEPARRRSRHDRRARRSRRRYRRPGGPTGGRGGHRMNDHLLSMHDLSSQEVTRILDTADSFREVGSRVIKKVPALRGRTVVNFFLESSTRTRISFELAAKRLSADV